MCQHGALCHPVSGQCHCPAGFQGQFCERGECSTPHMLPPAPHPQPGPECWVWGRGDAEPAAPHQGVSQAHSERAAASSVTARVGCPVTLSLATAFAPQGAWGPPVTLVSLGSHWEGHCQWQILCWLIPTCPVPVCACATPRRGPAAWGGLGMELQLGLSGPHPRPPTESSMGGDRRGHPVWAPPGGASLTSRALCAGPGAGQVSGTRPSSL